MCTSDRETAAGFLVGTTGALTRLSAVSFSSSAPIPFFKR